MLENRQEIRPSSGAAPFAAGEVFYSRTDRRGVILSGNYVFQRVAHYPWEELLGAPHKLIRHPDMPKGVFQILWDHILAGKTVGAYVKNRAKDGLYYWVYSVVAPFGEEFISARIKPTSALLEAVEGLYARMLVREREEGLTPVQSAEQIAVALQGMGFATYEDFASAALSQELCAERAQMGLPDHARARQASDVLAQVHGLMEQAATLRKRFAALRSVPRNLQVKASRIEPTGGPLTALSNDYSYMSLDMERWFTAQVLGADNNFARIAEHVKAVLYTYAICDILGRCVEQFGQERRAMGSVDVAREIEMLEALMGQMASSARTISGQIAAEIAALRAACKTMDRMLMGLNTVRVTGKIETARLGAASLELGDIIEQLGTSQGLVEGLLRDVQGSLDGISQGVDVLRRMEPEAFPYPLTVRAS